MLESHTVFQPPENDTCKLWRYLDFTKFISMLSMKALFFSRADELGDPFEGSWPQKNRDQRPMEFESMGYDKDYASVIASGSAAHSRTLKTWVAVNCWHANDHESAAMWRLYLKAGEGIAVQSSYDRLRQVLSIDFPDTLFLGVVDYIDFEHDYFPNPNWLQPFVLKRKSFEHEKEVRAVLYRYPQMSNGDDPSTTPPPFDHGINVPVDLNMLIEAVYVAPTTPRWFFDLVKDVLAKYHISKPVFQSTLDQTPVY